MESTFVAPSSAALTADAKSKWKKGVSEDVIAPASSDRADPEEDAVNLNIERFLNPFSGSSGFVTGSEVEDCGNPVVTRSR